MPTRSRWIPEGTVVGLVAFATVAVFYAALDLLGGRAALHTVNALGVAFTRGTVAVPPADAPVAIAWGGVLTYSLVHLGASLAIGMLVCRLVFEAELRPMQAQVALLFIVAGFAGTIGLVGAWTTGLRAVLPWWSIITANALAVLAAGTVMLRRHPGFLSEMTANPRFPAA